MSNLLDKSSILLTPTAYNDGKILSVKPNTSVGDFDFTRNSSGTRVGSNGLIEDITSNLPRIDYTGGTGHWLFEPQSTNLLTYSEQFDNASWINNGVTINANQVVSPDGALTADLLTGVSGGFGVVKFSTWTATNKVASCFAKAGSTNLFKIANVSGGIGGVTFNLQNGTITNEDSGFEGEIENYGNGWFKCTAIDTSARSGTFSLGVTAASESVYIWGAQLESGSFATSYIPTSGSQVTRLQDAAFGAGSSDLINSTEGVLYVEVAALAEQTLTRYITLSDGTSSNRIIIYITDVGVIKFFVGVGGATQAAKTVSGQTTTNFNKLAVSYKENDMKFYLNGVKVHTDTSASTFPANTLNVLNFAASNGTSSPFFGKAKCLAVFKEALTDAELTCLTTI